LIRQKSFKKNKNDLDQSASCVEENIIFSDDDIPLHSRKREASSFKSMAEDETLVSFMLLQNSRKRVLWDCLIVFLMFIIVYLIPILAAFKSFVDHNKDFIFVKDIVIKSIFLIDIILNFRTTQINEKTGVEIKNPKLVAIRYLTSKYFVCDIVALIDFSIIYALMIG
jgi:hypothetical protein